MIRFILIGGVVVFTAFLIFNFTISQPELKLFCNSHKPYNGYNTRTAESALLGLDWVRCDYEGGGGEYLRNCTVIYEDGQAVRFSSTYANSGDFEILENCQVKK